MELSFKRHSITLFFQFLFLLIDLGVNTFSHFARGDKLITVLVYLVQDICLILSFAVVIYSMYSTYLYQTGATDILYQKFRLPLMIHGLYFILCIIHHVWIILIQHRAPFVAQWPTALAVIYSIQRFFSPVYYYLYKRTALRMGDPRFYKNDWDGEMSLAMR